MPSARTINVVFAGHRAPQRTAACGAKASANAQQRKVGSPPRVCENASCLIEAGTKSWRLGCPDLSKVVTVVK
jgi:hypothetical protein